MKRQALVAICAVTLQLCGSAASSVIGAEQVAKPTIRGVMPRATQPIQIDGELREYAQAFCTPVEYFNADVKNRPAQFFYLWDDEACYVAVRTLDETPFTPEEPFWVGDAIEWYFDARRDSHFLSDHWGPGAVHCFFAGVHGRDVEPRFSLRPGFEDAIPAKGVQVAARRSKHGLEIEFKMPWENFPTFHARAGEILGLDAELSYSDGVSRSFRAFAFGGPLSVDQPANLATVELVRSLEKDHWQACGPVMMPIRIDVPWRQSGPPLVEARIALPPNYRQMIGKVEFELRDVHGALLATHAASEEEVLERDGDFVRRVARWPVASAPAGQYVPIAIVFDAHGKELTRVAPRLVSVNMDQGY